MYLNAKDNIRFNTFNNIVLAIVGLTVVNSVFVILLVSYANVELTFFKSPTIANTRTVSGNLKKTTMAYITKANSKRILRKINLNDIPDIAGEVYKKPIYFLSKWETKYLLLMQSLLKEPEKFAIEGKHPANYILRAI